MSLLLAIVFLPALGLLLLVAKFARHWFRQAHLHDLPGPPRASLISGNLNQLLSLNSWKFHEDLPRLYGRVARVWGLMGDTRLYVSDSRALYNILIKDQYIFDEPDFFIEQNHLILGDGLLATRGEHHRKQRKVLNPVFSTKHMKFMVPIFYGISHQLSDAFKSQVAEGPKEIDMIRWITRLALELIGQGGLGHSFTDLDQDADDKYSSTLKELVVTTSGLAVPRLLLPFAAKIGTPAFRRWVVHAIPWPTINKLEKMTGMLDDMSRNIYNAKKVALEKGDDAVTHQVSEGRDILSVLMRANMSASEQDRLPEEEIIGQMSTLVLAAMDTTSTALCRILQLLSLNPVVQDKLREELIQARQNLGGDLDYDTLHEVPYLEAVCRETLRLYPPVMQLHRTSRKDVMLPLGTPIIDRKGKEHSELFIPQDTNIVLAIRAVNTDPLVWGDDAAEWKPERWLSPLPESVKNANIPGVYSNTLTFLGGGRACIGFKFSQLEMKVLLSLLLPNFRFSPSKKEIEWKSAGIATPVVVGSSKPALPLIVSLA